MFSWRSILSSSIVVIMVAKANTAVVKIALSRTMELPESLNVRGAAERKNMTIISVTALEVKSIRARKAPKFALTAIAERRLRASLSPLEMM